MLPDQDPWEFPVLSAEEKARIRTLDEAYMASVLWVEDFACNRSRADKSWVARVEESDQQYFSEVRLVPKS